MGTCCVFLPEQVVLAIFVYFWNHCHLQTQSELVKAWPIVAGSLKALADTLSKLLRGNSAAVAYLACCKRNPATHGEFLRILDEHQLNVACTPHSRMNHNLQFWDVLNDCKLELMVLCIRA